MSSSAEFGGTIPVTILQYRDISGCAVRDAAFQPDGRSSREEEANERRSEQAFSAAEMVARIERERADAASEAETRVRKEYEQKLLAAREPIATLLAGFEGQRNEYFARVEAEVVQLALSIAAKILHREAQVDPMLVAALVRIAVEKMREGSSVTVRVSSDQVGRWRHYFEGFANLTHVEVAEDTQLGTYDCWVETELGSANFGLDTQLKEVEQGFFDLMALRPTSR